MSVRAAASAHDRRPDAHYRTHRLSPLRLCPVERGDALAGNRRRGPCPPLHAQIDPIPPGEKSEGIMQLVVSPGHAPLIQHVIPEIIERVNRFFGYRAVAKIKMRQGAVQAPRGSEPQPRKRPTAALAQAGSARTGRQPARRGRSGTARGAQIAGAQP
jgi:hypothetical protein